MPDWEPTGCYLRHKHKEALMELIAEMEDQEDPADACTGTRCVVLTTKLWNAIKRIKFEAVCEAMSEEPEQATG